MLRALFFSLVLVSACTRRAPECVEPEAYVREHDVDTKDRGWLFGLWNERPSVTVAFAPDLDGDGRSDLMAHGHEDCGSGGCTWDLFVSDRSCTRHVGWILGDDPTPRITRHEGMADLDSKFWGGTSYEELHYEFRAGEYVQTERRECDGSGACDPWVMATDP